MITLLTIVAIIAGEVYLSIRIGEWIGAWKTVLIMVGLAAAGLFLAKLEAFALIKRLEAEFKAGASMTDASVEITLLIIGAVLLVIPGFITDIIAFLFILPPTRAWCASRVSPKFRHKVEQSVEKKRRELLERAKQQKK